MCCEQAFRRVWYGCIDVYVVTWLKYSKSFMIFMTQQYYHIFSSISELTLEIIINFWTIFFIMNYICVRNYLLSWVLKISWWVLSYASSGCSTVARTWHVVSTILLFSSLNSSIEQIENCLTKFSSAIIVLNSLLSSSRLPYSRYTLRSRGHQFSLQNTILYKNVFVNRCLFQYI